MRLLRRLAVVLVFDGPSLPGWLAVALFDFGMGRRGKRIDVLGA